MCGLCIDCLYLFEKSLNNKWGRCRITGHGCPDIDKGGCFKFKKK